MPWELGLGDGIRSQVNVSLFPAARDSWDDDWLGSEYLALYSRIERGKFKGQSESHWLVRDAERRIAIRLEGWLANRRDRNFDGARVRETHGEKGFRDG